MPSKLHHYVWRFYLRAWTLRELIYCLREGEIFRPNIKGVGCENYFYRLQEMTPDDIAFLREVIIADSPEGLRESHEFLIRSFNLPIAAKQHFEEEGLPVPPVIDEAIVQMNEDFHTKIEESFQPQLRSMIDGDLSFVEDPHQAAIFFRAVSTQYARTTLLKRSSEHVSPERFETYLRVANVLVHIMATNVGLSMFARRQDCPMLIIDNPSAIAFVTTDQPIINMAANPTVFGTPAKFELYYPLSPRKALLILEPSSDFLPSSNTVTAPSAHMWNLRMAAHADQLVFSSQPNELEAIRQELPAFVSCL